MIVVYIVTFVLSIIILRMAFSYAFLCEKRRILKLVENNKKLKNFIYFLLSTNTYSNFIYHLYKEHNIRKIDIWIKTTNESYLISEAFKWSNTMQGYDFWYETNLLWNRDFKHRDIEFLLIKNLIEERL